MFNDVVLLVAFLIGLPFAVAGTFAFGHMEGELAKRGRKHRDFHTIGEACEVYVQYKRLVELGEAPRGPVRTCATALVVMVSLVPAVMIVGFVHRLLTT